MYKKYLVNMSNGTGVTTPVFLRWRFRNHQLFVRICIWATLVSRNRLFIEVVKNTASWLP